MKRIMEDVMNEKVSEGSAVLRWLGQMGLLVRMGQTVLCIDYFASDLPGRQVLPPVPVEEMAGVDIFLGTHNHLDHIDHPAWRTWASVCPNAKFVFPGLHQAEILADGIAADRCVGMNDGGCVRIGGVTVHAVAASHEFLDRDEKTGLYPYLGYVIQGNGVTLYHSGDTCLYEGMAACLRQWPIDIALLPINGRDAARLRRNCIGNMTYQEAADLAGAIRPRITVPAHFDMFRGNTANPREFLAYMACKYPDLKTFRPRLGVVVEL